MAEANRYSDKTSNYSNNTQTEPKWRTDKKLGEMLEKMRIGYIVSHPQRIIKQWEGDKPHPVNRYTLSLTSFNEHDGKWRVTHSFDWFCGVGVEQVGIRDIMLSLFDDMRMLNGMSASEVFGSNDFGYGPDHMARIVREITGNSTKLHECLGRNNTRKLLAYFND